MTGRRSVLLWAAVLAGLAAVSPAGGQADGRQAPQQPPPRPVQGGEFRSGVDLVSLSVTVTDPSGRYVTDLAPEDFSVFEDGVKQDVTFFNRSNLPIAVSLLLDTSASMEDKMATVQAAAIGFAQRLRPQDLGQLVDFDTRVTIAQPFTSKPEDLEKAIKATAAGGSTALYNAIYIALRELKKSQVHSSEDIRREAIVLLSDGEDTSSLVSFDEVLDLAKRSETSIYAIAIRSSDPYIRKGFKEAEYVLREFTSQTGGRLFFPAKIEDLPAVYDQISQELSSQYLVGYTSRNPRRDGQWRRLVVRLARPNLVARAKQGYYGPTS